MDDKHVSALGEVVVTAGAEDALAEFAHGEEDVGKIIGAVGFGGAVREGWSDRKSVV